MANIYTTHEVCVQSMYVRLVKTIHEYDANVSHRRSSVTSRVRLLKLIFSNLTMEGGKKSKNMILWENIDPCRAPN